MVRVQLRKQTGSPLGSGLGGCAVELRGFDPARGRWEAKLAGSGATVLVPPGGLELEDGEEKLGEVRRREAAGDHRPAEVGEWPGREGQRALFATEDIPAGRVIFREDPLLVIPAPEECTWQVACLVGVEAFLQLPAHMQGVLLALHAEERFSVYSVRTKTMAMPDRDFRDPDTQQHFLSKEEVFLNTGLGEVVEDEAQSKDVWKFLRVMQANGMDFDGYNALFPFLSHMNHSCEPSASCLDHEDGKAVTALRDIRRGEQITISYIGESQLLEPPELRQCYLSHWGFRCGCARCAAGEEPLRAFLCPEGCGGGCVVSAGGSLTACDRCGRRADRDETQCLLRMEAVLVGGVLQTERNSRLLGQEPACLEELLEQAAELLSPLHWARARLHSLGRDHFRQRLDLEAAAGHAALELRFLRHHMRWPNPHAAFVGHALGDMLLALGRCAEAFSEYSAALHELLWVLPASSRLCEALRRKLRRALEGPAPEEEEEDDAASLHLAEAAEGAAQLEEMD